MLLWGKILECSSQRNTAAFRNGWSNFNMPLSHLPKNKKVFGRSHLKTLAPLSHSGKLCVRSAPQCPMVSSPVHSFGSERDAGQSLNKMVMQIKPELIALHAGGGGGRGEWEDIRAGHIRYWQHISDVPVLWPAAGRGEPHRPSSDPGHWTIGLAPSSTVPKPAALNRRPHYQPIGGEEIWIYQWMKYSRDSFPHANRSLLHAHLKQHQTVFNYTLYIYIYRYIIYHFKWKGKGLSLASAKQQLLWQAENKITTRHNNPSLFFALSLLAESSIPSGVMTAPIAPWL